MPAFYTRSAVYPPTFRRIYHDKDTCPLGRQVRPEHRLPGTGDRQPCPECKKVK